MGRKPKEKKVLRAADISELEIVRELDDARAVAQKQRIAFGNRLGAIERGDDHASQQVKDSLTVLQDRFQGIEDEITLKITEIVDGVEIIERACAVKGIGKILAAKLICLIDIRRAETISALWKYCGYAVDDEGKADRPHKGEKLAYNKRAKTVCYLIGTSLIRSTSPYRKIYDTSRTYYETHRKDWPKGRVHAAALRKTIKIFLSHLWVIWRQVEGLPITAPYVVAMPHHEHLYLPEEFGWEVVTGKSH